MLPTRAETDDFTVLSDTEKPMPTGPLVATTPPATAMFCRFAAAWMRRSPPLRTVASSSTAASDELPKVLMVTVPSTPTESELPPASVTVTTRCWLLAVTSTVLALLTCALPRSVALAVVSMPTKLADPPMAALPPLVPRNLVDKMPLAPVRLMSLPAVTLTAWLLKPAMPV